MTYTIDELFTAAEQEIAAWKSEGDKPRTDNDYMYLGFLRAVANRLPRVSQNSGKPIVSGSLPSDDRIVAEAIQAARKVNTEVGLLPNNNDIRMFCLGAKWMRDFAQSNDR